MRVMVADRGAGKTTELVRWVLDGTMANSYPGWSRVLVVANLQRYRALDQEWRERIEDFDHRVCDYRTWVTARNVDGDTEVVIDELVDTLPFIPGQLVGFSLTGELWLPRRIG
jgi:hypothetical protein